MGAVTNFTSHESNPRIISVRKSKLQGSDPLDRGHVLNTTIIIILFLIIFFYHHSHANGKLKLEAP